MCVTTTASPPPPADRHRRPLQDAGPERGALLRAEARRRQRFCESGRAVQDGGLRRRLPGAAPERRRAAPARERPQQVGPRPRGGRRVTPIRLCEMTALLQDEAVGDGPPGRPRPRPHLQGLRQRLSTRGRPHQAAVRGRRPLPPRRAPRHLLTCHWMKTGGKNAGVRNGPLVERLLDLVGSPTSLLLGRPVAESARPLSLSRLLSVRPPDLP